MKFCTAVNCMDGRVQLPVIEYLHHRFNADYVDMITEAGPNLILSNLAEPDLVQSIFNRILISVEKHNSVGIAVVGHFDCAGNPTLRDQQNTHTRMAMNVIRQRFSGIEIIGIWVDENWNVCELTEDKQEKG